MTSVNSAGIESDPGNEVDSPAVVFDVAFTFGADVLDTPTALALDPAASAWSSLTPRCTNCMFSPWMAGTRGPAQLSRWQPRRSARLGFNADGSRLYVTDATLKQCLILDADWQITGRFGTPGKNPGSSRALPPCSAPPTACW